jgi:site-specific DNA-methyltransferase (adenine-specific)
MPTIRLIHGDALEWLPRMETASVDVIFADPPYNLSGDGFLTCRSGTPPKVR